MKKLVLAVLLAGTGPVALGDTGPASQQEIEKAWLEFSNAKGQPSLILGDVNHPSANEVFRVIPEVGADSLDDEKLQLGLDLFRDPRLSRDGSIACVSCHVDLMGGVDHRPVSFGVGGAQGKLNAPTIFNAALNFRQFWDGRAFNLEEQVLGPIENPLEFDQDLDNVVAILKSLPEYSSVFDHLYPDGVTAANLGDAIAYYELINFTGVSSPFLRQFEDPPEPLNRQAQRGMQRFVEVGCASCHNGINLGGNSYQQLGIAEPWFGPLRVADEDDDGLFGRSGRDQDRHVFKVPTLHNVAATGPWLHDGSVASLAQAVDLMARYQSGRYLDDNDIDDIVAFLNALGDRLGLIGDCSVSGNYGVNMDCSMSKKGTGAEAAGLASGMAAAGARRSDIPADPAALARRHQQEYAAAQQRVSEAPARIDQEMQRIRSGQVAHFDFLQYEHIEMLRQARALSFPPTTVETAQRKTLLSEATQWQQSAQQYEFIIADFLRNQAIVSNARTNFQDLLHSFSLNADEKAQSLLARAERSALAFYARPAADTRLALESATLALNDLNLNPQRLEELQLQVRMLLENVSIPQV
ncbi:MAG: cytochrome c peroxidase [Gammaproteobacteria bacterium]|nr:c-type cytochrome [Pseudomonadales bacterium]